MLFFGLPRPSFIRSQFKRVDAGVGMAARAALPVLEAEVGVVEEHLAAALARSHCGAGPRAIEVTGFSGFGSRSTTASVSLKYTAT